MIDLKQLSTRYKVIRKGNQNNDNLPDDMLFGHPEHRQPRIPCEHGSIFAGRLDGLRALCVARKVITTLAEFAELHALRHCYTRWETSGGVSELTVECQPEHLDAIASILRARKRRQVTEEAKARFEAIRQTPATREKMAPESIV